jgi:hypothetical protein
MFFPSTNTDELCAKSAYNACDALVAFATVPIVVSEVLAWLALIELVAENAVDALTAKVAIPAVVAKAEFTELLALRA